MRRASGQLIGQSIGQRFSLLRLFSFSGQLALVQLLVLTPLLALALLLPWLLSEPQQTTTLYLLWAMLLLLAVLLHLLLQRVNNGLQQEIAALNLHADNLQDQAFNSRANRQQIRMLTPLADALDTMSAELSRQRATLYQRELLLDTVLQSSPSALVLTDDHNRVLLTNPAARQLFLHGQKFDGRVLDDVLAQWPELQLAFSGYLQQPQQGLLHLETRDVAFNGNQSQGQGAAIWHLSSSQFMLNQRQHFLYLLKPMTAEIQREELNAWKKLLRVIGHELNNSLAPLSSLAYSGQQLLEKQVLETQSPEKQAADLATLQPLRQILATISERSQHLNQFLQAYIQFAKLPPPKRDTVNWPRLINQLHDHFEFELDGELPKLAWQLDQSQLMQLLLNVLKNAHESGSDPAQIRLFIQETPQLLIIELQDAGGGLSAEVLEHALLPFYTTKTQGSGIGLTLCRDVAEAHGGGFCLRNQPPGLLVQVSLPWLANTV
ncbi:ATP-binding protein [Rheinheimera riviphila]|uniref:histidine kinase n=2 Tax=Rheinheimera riviphila TaxID=1834037 RepID=A0A437QJ95_9GAMM|nr:ATP-binding protein [Rheinheimera riviphila]